MAETLLDVVASRTPAPVANLRHVLTVTGDILFVLGELVAHVLFEMCGAIAERGHAIDNVHYQVKAIQVVEHRHIERCGGGALLLVAAHVKILVVGTAVTKTMNQPGIPVKSEHDGFVGGEQGVKILVHQTVWVLLVRL